MKRRLCRKRKSSSLTEIQTPDRLARSSVAMPTELSLPQSLSYLKDSQYLGAETSYFIKKVKVKWSRYRPGVAQRVGRGIALLFHDRDTRRGWVVSSTLRPHFTPGKDPVPILQEAGRASGPVWTVGKSHPHRDSIPDRPARSQSLHRLSYPVHTSYSIP